MKRARDGPRYAELACQSAFSFLRGASEPEVLVERAAALGYTALALADRDGLYGSPRLHAAGRRHALPVIHGTTLTLERAGARAYDGRPDGADDRLLLLARHEGGWQRLCRLVSAARLRSRTGPVTPLGALLDACACAVPGDARTDASREHGLLALIGPHLPDASAETLLDALGREHCALAVHDRLLKRDRRGQQVQRARAGRLGLPLVVTGGVRFARRGDKPLHDVLTCVRHGVTLDEASTRLLPNAEFCLRPVERIAHLFRHCPEALERSVELARRCTWSLDALAYRFPPFETPDGETPFSVLHDLAHAGARRRYRPVTPAVARQLAKELDMIERLDLAGYFLVVHDVVAFCEREGILCQGRGSAANSAVCYALGITSVDPIGMELLFERFLSEERGEVPDIDLDIAHQDRERVLQYVYARYGRDHAALAAEVVTYRTRSAVRDAGKALGFPLEQVDALAKSVDRRFDSDRDGVPEAWDALVDDARLPHLLRLVRGMSGLPRHLSIHVGGMIITGPPLVDLMPVEPAAMPGRTVVPWDKDDLATLGIIKIDLLGLGMLTVLDRCLALVNGLAAGGASRDASSAGRGALELHTVPPDDAATWDMLCAADTVGVFQVESRAQMNCLPRLLPRTFYDLVVEVALIRPGPIQGDMVHPYLRRRAGREPVTYPHPSLAPILRRTLGVPLFQEQGMKIAVAAAGFTPGEADELRRAMGHKRSRERMGALAERLVDGMTRHGIDREAAERILHQLSAFADYGFPESHAASFARLVWVSAWLKRHHPAPFLCALLNAQPMGFYAPAVLVSDARRHGVEVRPVDVLHSGWESTLEPRDGDGVAVRLGLCTVRGFGEGHAEAVRAALASRAERGPFTSPEDFARRAGLDQRLMEHLARLGALRGFERRRRQALWRVARMARRVPGPLAEPLPEEATLELPAMHPGEIVREDYLMGGVTLGRHPIELFRERLDATGVARARDLAERRDPRVAVAGMVICRQRPGTARGMTFVTLEDETGFCNLVVTPPVAEAWREGLRSQLVLAEGRLERADGVVNLRVESLRPLGDGGSLRAASHDYR
ncbi:MAG: error-prone DNA polymerase [Planctomycetes bacterium]|nr:error-prone DNA polymerase [Planctomycetota bacterium]